MSNVFTGENAAKWDEVAVELDRPRQWVLERVKRAATQLRGHYSLLDVGCGTGRWTKQFARYVPGFTVGVDNSQKMISIAKRKNGDINILYLRCDFSKEFPRGENSIVTSLASLHHVSDRNALNKLYGDIRSVLGPQGHFIFYVPHPVANYTNLSKVAKVEFDQSRSYNENFPMKATIDMGGERTRVSDFYHHSLEEYTGDVIQAGFDITKLEEITAEGDRIPFALVVDAVRREII